MKTLTQPDDVEEIRGRFLTLQESDTPMWGEMNVAEMVCHLREAYRYPFLPGDAPALKMPLPPKVMKWAALRVPREWPKDVPTIPELKVGAPAMQVTEFAQDRDSLMEIFERFSTSRHEKSHPIFGPMKHEEWMRWGYLHADHHLRQFGR